MRAVSKAQVDACLSVTLNDCRETVGVFNTHIGDNALTIPDFHIRCSSILTLDSLHWNLFVIEHV